jgi:hypothetical protein
VKRRFVSFIAALLVFTPLAQARFMSHQIEQVPIGRLLTNLQQRLATNSQSTEILYQLARVHSMAYATELTIVPVKKSDGAPMFQHPGSDTGVPTEVSPRATPQAQTEARRHLTDAIIYYERAARLVKGTNVPTHQWLIVPIHLGFAWCVDQAGRRDDAIEAYRNALQHAWRQEVDDQFAVKEGTRSSWDRLRAGRNPFGQPTRVHIGPGVCYTEEIVGYLLKLLDPMKDAQEIAQLESDRKALRLVPRAITPIVVPLHAGAPLDELVNAQAQVAFDLDGSGEQRRWGWITTNAAWLVFDRDGSGRITSGLQMFGNVTFWIFWRNGYDALSSLDDNGNGKLSGSELRGLALWHDRNSNGVSEPGEVTPAAELGIVAIDCRSEPHSSAIQFNERGVTFRDGATRPTYDWIAPSR